MGQPFQRHAQLASGLQRLAQLSRTGPLIAGTQLLGHVRDNRHKNASRSAKMGSVESSSVGSNAQIPRKLPSISDSPVLPLDGGDLKFRQLREPHKLLTQ